MAGDIKVTVSYMQIYNQTGYDLMTDDNETCKLEDLRKVHPLEDKNGLLHLKNLHRYVVEDEDQALNKLFIGDTNRVTCKTDKNDQSTRSHCIFII